jgi:hypothetical protein
MEKGYEIKKIDLIPLVGVINHHRRSVQGYYQTMGRATSGQELDYQANAFGRDVLLLLYNTAITTVGILAASGIESLLQK